MQILDAMEKENNWMEELLEEAHHEHHHEHHHHEHGEECSCGCGCHEHEHEHHHHEHHHEHGEECSCGCHEHDHHHDHHHADEIFTSWGKETAASYTKEEIAEKLAALEEEKVYGFVLRAKGMLPDGNGGWTYFDYVPGEVDIRDGKPDITGKICVIGSKMQEEALAELFAK